MDKVAAAVFQEILTQPQYEKVAMCLYNDIQLRTEEKLASFYLMEKDAAGLGDFFRNIGTNPKVRAFGKNIGTFGNNVVSGIKNSGRNFVQGVKEIPTVVKGSVTNPRRMGRALNRTLAGITPSELTTFVTSNLGATDPVGNAVSMLSTVSDASSFLRNLGGNYRMLG